MSAVLPEHSEPPTIAAERECGATPLRAGGAVDAEELAALRAENAALKSRLRELEQQQRTEPFVPGVLPADAVLGRGGVDGGLRTPLLRLMAEAAPVLLWMTSSDGESIYFNQAWLAFTGRRLNQELGFGWVASLHPEDATPVVGAFLAAFAAKTPFGCDYRLRRHDGAYRWVSDSAVPVYRTDGVFLGYVGSCSDVTARVEAEEALRSSQERLQLMLRGSQDAAWDWDLATKTAYCSPQWWGMLGRQPEPEICPYVLLKRLVHPDDFLRGQKQVQDAMLSGADSFEVEVRFVHQAGHYVPMLVRGAILRTPDGVVARIAGTQTNLTERKKAEERLRRSHELLSLTGQVAKVGGWRLDLETQDLSCTEEINLLCDVDPAIRLTLAEGLSLFDREVHETLRAALHAAASDGIPWDLTVPLTTKLGRSIWLRTLGSVERKDGQNIAIYGTMQDVTAIKNAEQALLDSQAMLNNVVQSAMDAIIAIDENLSIVIFNPSAQAIFGYELADVIGQPIAKVIPPEFGVDGQIASPEYPGKNVAETPIHRWGIFQGRRKNGENFPIESSVSTVIVAGRKLQTVILRDITARIRAESDRKMMEAQLHQAQKLEAIGQLSGGVAHDFNNLLTAILGNATLLQDSGLSLAEREELLDEIQRAGNRAADLVKQLLIFSQRQITYRRVVNINDVVYGCLLSREERFSGNITLITDFCPEPVLMLVDTDMLSQVFQALIENALDAMPDGGVLTIRSENCYVDESAIAINANARLGYFAKISIVDSGCGIPDEHMPRLFDPFFTTKDIGKGSGLGLSTVYGVVKQHQGWIEIKSQLAIGTSVVIYFPSGSAAGA